MFFKRHSNRLSLRKGKIYECNRDADRDKSTLEAFYEEVKRVVEIFELTPEDIWNCDETGVTAQGKSAGKVLSEKGSKVAGSKRSNNRENLSMLVTINAAGRSLPPLYIFKGKRLDKQWIHGAPEGSRFTYSDSSFINSDIFLEWLKHFIVLTPRNRKQILFFDGHRSHVTEEAINFARENNVELFQLPSHTSHVTQPLDVSVFGVFKQFWEQVLLNYSLTHGGEQPRKADLVGLTAQPLQAALSQHNISQAFAGAGIWPVDCSRALERLTKSRTKKSLSFNVPVDIPIAVDSKTLEENLTSPIKRRLEEEGIQIESARTHLLMLSHVIAPKKRRSLKKSEADECLFLDEGGLLTSDKIQQKIAAREAKRAEAKEAKEQLQKKRAEAKTSREQKKRENEEKRQAKRLLAEHRAQAKQVDNQVVPELEYRLVEI